MRRVSGVLRPSFAPALIEEIASWISHFRTGILDVLSWVAVAIPLEWYKGELSALIARLTDRLDCLPELVRADGAKSWQLMAQKTKDETLRLSDSGIYGVRTQDTRETVHRGLEDACA